MERRRPRQQCSRRHQSKGAGMNWDCEISPVFLFGAILGLIIGGVIWGFVEAWWKDRK
jgi:hypothetical protein